MDLVETISQHYNTGYQEGVDNVMRDLHEMLFNGSFTTAEERDTIRKVYELLYASYPEKL